jgi:RNA polymerase sigma factor (sigma-70 family)
MGIGLLARARGLELTTPARVDSTDAELLDRFARMRDQVAFAALVRRHGPMVFGVCRRVLRDANDAEEAFQVTFLVLVRKAAGLREPGRLANWLYGVANRVARKARVSAARRDKHERVASNSDQSVAHEPEDSDVRAVLDEEMVCLPDKYRAPLVLCYLEGLTNEAAAERLGWPPGSMSYRLARGREMLRKRLVRRGVCLALWPIFWQTLSESASARSVPPTLVRTAVDRAAREAEPEGAAALTWRPALVVVLVVLLLGFGTAAVAAFRPGSRPQSQPPAASTSDGATDACPVPAPHRCHAVE